jgi:hypothetical protein
MVSRAEVPGGMLIGLPDGNVVGVVPSDYYLNLAPDRYPCLAKREQRHLDEMRRELLALPLSDREWISHYIAGLDLGRFCRHSWAGWREVLRCYRQFREKVEPHRRWILLQFIAQCLEGSHLWALYHFDEVPRLDEAFPNNWAPSLSFEQSLSEFIVGEINRRLQALMVLHEREEKERIILDYRSAPSLSIADLRRRLFTHHDLIEIDGTVRKAKVNDVKNSLCSDGFVELRSTGRVLTSGAGYCRQIES